ncbi:MAG: ABC transporter permease [Actinomycetota bacterium]|nr:ABC transporter permease [Actinomycetota bacterium]
MTIDDLVVESRPASGPDPTDPDALRPSGAHAAWDGIRRFVRTEPLGAVSLGLILVFVLAAILAPLIAPHDPLEQFRRNMSEPASRQFLLGTDDLGRDVLSRVIYGARTSLLIGLATTVTSCALGTVIGIVSGFLGRRMDVVVQRVMDSVQSVPPLVLLLFIAVSLGPSIRNTVIALTVITLPSFNRVARGETLRIREEGYIEAARATGASTARIMARHVLPNMVAAMMTMASLVFASVIIAESALSFLGIGTPPPTPSWGLMLAEGLRFVQSAPWMVLAPAITLSLAVLAFNMLGDALRDFLDPRLHRSR